MRRTVKALVISTTFSLIGLTATTAAGAPQPWLGLEWAFWAVLAAATMYVVVLERRQDA